MDNPTKILIALGIVAVLVIGGIIIASIPQPEPVDPEPPYVKVKEVNKMEGEEYYVIYFSYDHVKPVDIIFYADGVELPRFSIGGHDYKGHYGTRDPPVVPTMDNLTWSVR